MIKDIKILNDDISYEHEFKRKLTSSFTHSSRAGIFLEKKLINKRNVYKIYKIN